jgi:hypothetical protein
LTVGLYAATRQPGYPVPHVQGPTVPQSVAPGGPDFTLTVYGANFIPGSTVNWNRQARATTYISAHKLQAQILASDIAINTAGMITVTTTSPYGPITSSTYFQVEVHSPMPTMSTTENIVKTGFMGFSGGVADFNNDGFLDLAGGADLLNDGDGLFHLGGLITDKEYPYQYGGNFGDFNGDGNVDYLYLRASYRDVDPAPLAISFGNGDGTFTPGPTFGSFGNQFGPYVPDLAVGDFNQDGTLDVGATIGFGYLAMFLGDGDGTFTRGGTMYVGDNFGFVVGDFNGDGKLDLLARSQEATSDNTNQFALDIFLGNGDGTFKPPQRVAIIPVPMYDLLAPSYLVGDFNNDGKLDIAFGNYVGQIGIVLGNGDGTFQPPVYYAVGSKFYFTFALGDFNSDGNTDIVVQQTYYSDEFSILLGNGDGTFQKKQKVNTGGCTNCLFNVADFNNDGLLDFEFPGFEGYSVYLQQ